MKNILTILLFLLFLTSPLIIQYNGTEPQFQGKVQAKEQCEGDDEDCEEEGEEDSNDENDHDEDDDEDEDHKDQEEEHEGDEYENEDKDLGESVKTSPGSPTSCTSSAAVVGDRKSVV